MFNLPILESFLDKEVIAGYTWGNILEYWWIGLIIIIVAAVGLVHLSHYLTDLGHISQRALHIEILV